MVITNKEQIYQLDTTIRKRLGKKANQIWDNLKDDLFIADLIRNHINRTTVNYSEPIEKTDCVNYAMEFVCQYTYKQLDEEGKAVITNWLKENIDKDRLKEWLEDTALRDSEILEILKYRIHLKEDTLTIDAPVFSNFNEITSEKKNTDIAWVEASGFVFKNSDDYKILKEWLENDR